MQATPSAVGERIRHLRKTARKTQAVVAGLAGITDAYLYQIERGSKTPTIALLYRIAAAIGVPPAALLGEVVPPQRKSGRPPVEPVVRAFLALTAASIPGSEPPNLDDVRSRLESAWSSWQTSRTRYSSVIPVLPDLIRDVEQARRLSTSLDGGPDHRRSAALSAELNFLLRSFWRRVGRNDLALLAADRAARSAEEADCRVRDAAAQWNLSHVLVSGHEYDGAEDVALRAADRLRPILGESGLRAVAMYGALQLIAAIAGAGRGDIWAARARVGDAAPTARRTGETNVYWTVFGPTNVLLHAVNVEMRAGEAAEALRLVDKVDDRAVASLERRATLRIEAAQCHEQRRDDHGAMLALLIAEREAPEELRYNAAGRDLLHTLDRRARGSLAVDLGRLVQRLDTADR